MRIGARARRWCLPSLATLLAAVAPNPSAAAPDPPTAEAVLAHPEAVGAFDYAIAVKSLWERGSRQQAAFWFYVFQARTRPWALADRGGDGAAALRSALNDELGQVINAWVASDPAAWRTLAARAISYERRLPPSKERPTGMDAAAWSALVGRSRAEYAAQMEAAFAGIHPAEFAAERRANGLPVGPWSDPGPPLPDGWR